MALHGNDTGIEIQLASLFQLFHQQSTCIRSLTVVGLPQLASELAFDLGLTPTSQSLGLSAVVMHVPPKSVPSRIAALDSVARLQDLAQTARELYDRPAGEDLLVISEALLEQRLSSPETDLGFRAVAVVYEDSPGPVGNPGGANLRRSLFDHGLLLIGALDFSGMKLHCFLVSSEVRTFNDLHIETRGSFAITKFNEGARFANLLFRYAFAKLYAWRHAITPLLPKWDGAHYFGLHDQPPDGVQFPLIKYFGFDPNDHELWNRPEPYINIDLEGYFQEIPHCWRKHRALLSHLFSLNSDHRQAIAQWRDTVTEGGTRTLVAIHIRRGDYREKAAMAQFQLIPGEWYLEWLRALWPTLPRPILFVATDEAGPLLQQFNEFEQIKPDFPPPASELPPHMQDFEALRAAGYLAIVNSSFGRMAAILALPDQKCFLASIEERTFLPYNPWSGPGFWKRFSKRPDVAAPPQPTVLLEITDLIQALLHHTPISGNRRTQCELLTRMAAVPSSIGTRLRYVILNSGGELAELDGTSVLAILNGMCSAPRSEHQENAVEEKVRLLIASAVPSPLAPNELLLLTGAFWTTPGIGAMLQKARNHGTSVGALIPDVLRITAPEYFEPGESRLFAKGLSEVRIFANVLIAATGDCQDWLEQNPAPGSTKPALVRRIPLDWAPSSSPDTNALRVSDAVASLLGTPFVLSPGPIEARNNPEYVVDLWKMLATSGRSDIPRLVLAGQKRSHAEGLIEQLEDSDYLAGRVIILDVTQPELQLLYRNSLLTIFPGFAGTTAEPAASLQHGKVCLCSTASPVPEIAEAFIDPIDPYNIRDGFERVSRYLDNPELRQTREREIASQYPSRSWEEMAGDSLRVLEFHLRPADIDLTFPAVEPVAVHLPPGRFLPISSEGVITNIGGISEILPTDLICVSGWLPAQPFRIRAAQAETAIRFRVDFPPGSRVNVVARIAAFHLDMALRVQPGLGDPVFATVPKDTSRQVPWSCVVQPGGIVRACISAITPTLGAIESAEAPYWMLEGILYFDPKRLLPKGFSANSN